MTTKQTFGQYFETLQRAGGTSEDTFVTLKDSAPEWMLGAVRDAMRNEMSDWLWEECEAAVNAIDEGSLTSADDVDQYADGRVEIYTRERFKWAAVHCLLDTFTEAEAEVEENGLAASDASIADRIAAVQFCAIRYIAEVILNAVEEYGDATEESDDTDGETPSVEA